MVVGQLFVGRPAKYVILCKHHNKVHWVGDISGHVHGGFLEGVLIFQVADYRLVL